MEKENIKSKPTKEQIQIINNTIGTCRYVYDFYLAHNKEVYEKEKSYIPTNKLIKSGTVSRNADRYYVSVLVEENEAEKPKLNDFGLGIDLGIKEFAVISNGTVKKNINKTAELKKLEKQLKREQRCLSRKYEDLKKRSTKKGEATKQNIQKQVIKVQKLHHRINCIRQVNVVMNVDV